MLLKHIIYVLIKSISPDLAQKLNISFVRFVNKAELFPNRSVFDT